MAENFHNFLMANTTKPEMVHNIMKSINNKNNIRRLNSYNLLRVGHSTRKKEKRNSAKD